VLSYLASYLLRLVRPRPLASATISGDRHSVGYSARDDISEAVLVSHTNEGQTIPTSPNHASPYLASAHLTSYAISLPVAHASLGDRCGSILSDLLIRMS
jgi:hypothetical protein